MRRAVLRPVYKLKTSDTGSHIDAASQIELPERFVVGLAKPIGGR